MRLIIVFIFIITVFPLASCDKGDDSSSSNQITCNDTNIKVTDFNFVELIGSHKLAVRYSAHEVFSIGLDRTEFIFTICADGEIYISSTNGEAIRKLKFGESDTTLIKWADYSTISLERFSDIAPYHEKFTYFRSENPTTSMAASYYSTLEGTTSWGSSSGIKGTKVPEELIKLDGVFTLINGVDEYILTLDAGTAKLTDENSNVLVSYVWDGEYDQINLPEIDENTTVLLFKNSDEIFSYLQIHMNQNYSGDMKAIYIDEDSVRLVLSDRAN